MHAAARAGSPGCGSLYRAGSVLQDMHRRATVGIFTDRRPRHAFRSVRLLVSPAHMVKPGAMQSRKKKWLLPNFPYASNASRMFSHA
jgi:hypothetical protein